MVVFAHVRSVIAERPRHQDQAGDNDRGENDQGVPCAGTLAVLGFSRPQHVQAERRHCCRSNDRQRFEPTARRPRPGRPVIPSARRDQANQRHNEGEHQRGGRHSRQHEGCLGRQKEWENRPDDAHRDERVARESLPSAEPVQPGVLRNLAVARHGPESARGRELAQGTRGERRHHEKGRQNARWPQAQRLLHGRDHGGGVGILRELARHGIGSRNGDGHSDDPVQGDESSDEQRPQHCPGHGAARLGHLLCHLRGHLKATQRCRRSEGEGGEEGSGPPCPVDAGCVGIPHEIPEATLRMCDQQRAEHQNATNRHRARDVHHSCLKATAHRVQDRGDRDDDDREAGSGEMVRGGQAQRVEDPLRIEEGERRHEQQVGADVGPADEQPGARADELPRPGGDRTF
ncbi:unannotated protein [freshwater metagenome]|uniref:Unannotated protein n=1 Tax=freshwater metagenome TaxID=449393 RepID=A0A6J7SKL4_9ZZZZ